MIDKLRKFLSPSTVKHILIVGLGNVGAEFVDTRHNAGFLAVEAWRERWDIPAFGAQKKLYAQIARGKIQTEVQADIKDAKRAQNQAQTIILAKPTTMVNRSGAAVSALMSYYQIPRENIIIVHDDADLPIGTVKTTDNSGDAGHNGIRDIISVLGTKQFKRIRIGVRPILPPEAPRARAMDFVLRPFAQNERQTLNNIINNISLKLKEQLYL